MTAASLDAHVNLWAPPEEDLSRAPEPPLPDFDAAPRQLLQEMDENNIGAAVIVQTPWFAARNRWLRDCVATWPDRFVAICCELHPATPDARLRLRDAIVENGMRGTRILLNDAAQFADLAAGYLDPYLGAVEALSVPICLSYLDPVGHDLVADRAARFPNVKFVIDHLGHAVAGDKGAESSLLSLHERPNVYVKMSLHHRMSRQSFPWNDLWELQKQMVTLFGAERLTWGSGYPIGHPEVSYGERLDAINMIPSLTAEQRRQILSETAKKLWFEAPSDPV